MSVDLSRPISFSEGSFRVRLFNAEGQELKVNGIDLNPENLQVLKERAAAILQACRDYCQAEGRSLEGRVSVDVGLDQKPNTITGIALNSISSSKLLLKNQSLIERFSRNDPHLQKKNSISVTDLGVSMLNVFRESRSVGFFSKDFFPSSLQSLEVSPHRFNRNLCKTDTVGSKRDSKANFLSDSSSSGNSLKKLSEQDLDKSSQSVSTGIPSENGDSLSKIETVARKNTPLRLRTTSNAKDLNNVSNLNHSVNSGAHSPVVSVSSRALQKSLITYDLYRLCDEKVSYLQTKLIMQNRAYGISSEKITQIQKHVRSILEKIANSQKLTKTSAEFWEWLQSHLQKESAPVNRVLEYELLPSPEDSDLRKKLLTHIN